MKSPAILSRLLLAVLLSVTVLAVPARAAFQFTDLHDPLAQNETYAAGISGTNIVGYYFGALNSYVGFYYNGAYTRLSDASGADGTLAYGISGTTIVGGYTDSTTRAHAFLLTGTTFTTMDDPLGAKGSTACGIDGGNVVGYYYDTTDKAHGFLLSGTTYSTLDDPSGPGATYALGISGSNIVGYYTDADQLNHGFLLTGTTYTSLDAPLAVNGTWACGVDGSNIVGYYADTKDAFHGFLYSGATYTTLDDPSGVGATYALGISGSNIVGYYANLHTKQTLIVGFQTTITGDSGASAAPEPGKYTLLLSVTGTDATLPVGTGYATLTLSKKEAVVIAGKLPDGEALRVSGKLSGPEDSQFVINQSLTYSSAVQKAKGFLSGTLDFVKVTGTSDLNGLLSWLKPQQTKGDYLAPIDTNLAVIGSFYTPPARGQSVLPGFTIGTIELSDTGTLSVSGSGPLLKDITLTPKNTITVTDPGTDKLKVTITPSTGAIRGSFLYPIPGKKPKTVDLSGVLYQDQAMGAGLFLGPNSSGAVILGGTN